jgi:chromosome segregation ATPase
LPDEPISLELLARQQRRILEEIRSFREEYGPLRDDYGSVREQLGSLRDDMPVLTAIVMRLDGTMTRLLQELRAMHSKYQRMANRVVRLEEERQTERE